MTLPSPGQSNHADAEAERRLHPLSWVFTAMTNGRSLLLPALVLLVTARFTNADVLLLPAVIVVAINAVVQQRSLRYVLGSQAIVVRRNLIVHRSERHIPYARIHNLKTSETPLHRWLGVVEVGIETASETESEATMRVLSREALAEIRTRIAAGALGSSGTRTDAPAASDAQVVFTLPMRGLILHGLVSNRGIVIAGAMAGLAWEGLSVAQGGEPWSPRAWAASWDLLNGRAGDVLDAIRAESVAWLLVVATLILVGLEVLSIAWSMITLHGFRVERSRDGITIEHGLLPRTSTVIPYTRIQRVVVRESPVHRLTGHVEVRLDTAGRSGSERSREAVWLAPLAPRALLPHLLAQIGAPIALDAVAWQPLHPRAGRRLRARAMSVVAIVAALALPIFGRWAVFAAVVVGPLALAMATRQARRYGYAVDRPYFLLRRGCLWRRVHLAWLDRVQATALMASPLDRHHGMAVLLVDTAAGGSLYDRLQVPYLGADTARAVQRRLQAETASTRFEW